MTSCRAAAIHNACSVYIKRILLIEKIYRVKYSASGYRIFVKQLCCVPLIKSELQLVVLYCMSASIQFSLSSNMSKIAAITDYIPF